MKIGSTRAWMLVLTASLAVPFYGCIDNGYVLRGVKKEGSIVREESVFAISGGKMAFDIAGNRLEGDIIEIIERHVSEIEYLRMENGLPASVRISFIEDSDKRVFEMLGQRNTETDEATLVGKTIQADLTEGRWVAHPEDGELTHEQQAELEVIESSLDFTDEMYPEQGIKVGHSWTIDPIYSTQWLGPNVREAGGTIDFEFQKITDVEGERCAQLRLVLDITAKLAEGNDQMEVNLSVSGSIFRSLDNFIDVKTELDGETRLEGAVTDGDQTVHATMKGPVTIRSTKRIQ
ncbi:hypothetical protein ACFLU6_03585 [Acidobacteriota bacterium]